VGVLTQMATSTMPVQQQVLATLDGASYNPASDPVYMAFVPQPAYGPPPNPTSGMWNAAYWETDPGGVYWASCMVGPSLDGVALTQGAYIIAVKVTDASAIPELWGWTLLIT